MFNRFVSTGFRAFISSLIDMQEQGMLSRLWYFSIKLMYFDFQSVFLKEIDGEPEILNTIFHEFDKFK